MAVYSTTASFDNGVRTALTSASERTGSPPANPFFYLHGDWTLRFRLIFNVRSSQDRGYGDSGREAHRAESVWSLTRFFFESYNEQALAALGIPARFVQDNHSASRLGVLRGPRYQILQS